MDLMDMMIDRNIMEYLAFRLLRVVVFWNAKLKRQLLMDFNVNTKVMITECSFLGALACGWRSEGE